MTRGKELTKTEVEDEVDLDRIDEVIWKYAGLKPVREIADLVGIKPEEVLRRKNQLLEEVDVLTIQQKRQRLLIELDGMARESRERAKGTLDEYYAGMLNSSIAAVKVVMVELARAEKADTEGVERLNQMRVRELLSLVDSAVVTSVRQIAETHDLDEAEIMSVFQDNLLKTAQERDVA